METHNERGEEDVGSTGTEWKWKGRKKQKRQIKRGEKGARKGVYESKGTTWAGTAPGTKNGDTRTHRQALIVRDGGGGRLGEGRGARP